MKVKGPMHLVKMGQQYYISIKGVIYGILITKNTTTCESYV